MPHRRSRPWRIGVVLFAALVLVSAPMPVGTASGTGGYAASPSQDGGWNDANAGGAEESTPLGIDGRIDRSAGAAAGSDAAVDPDNDRFEPNDGIDSAAEITVGTYDDLRIVDGEVDAFAVDRSAGDPLTARIEFDHSVGDLDLEVYGPNETRIDGRFSITDNESITVDAVPETGTYYVVVYGVENASAPYTLSVTEEEARTEVVRGHRTCSNVTGSGECPSGTETTTFDQGEFRAISVVEFADVNSSHRLTWEWYGPSGELYEVIETTTNEAGYYVPEYAHWAWIDVNGAGAALRPGEWEVVVYLDGARVVADTFTIEPSRTPGNDRFEPNAGFDSAAEITADTYDDLRIADDEYDVFAVNRSAGDSLSASIEFDHSVGDLDLSVYAPNETRMAGNVSTTDGESVTVDAVPETGTYYVVVYGYGGDSAPYSLTVGTESGDDPGPIDVTQELDRSTVQPGGSATVTARIASEEARDRLALSGSFTPEFAETTVEDVEFVRGSGSVVTSISGPGRVSFALRDLSAGAVVEIVYTVTVPDDAEPGDEFTIDSEVTSGDTTVSPDPATVSIGAGIETYADENGVVRTDGLNRAIGDWASGEISTEFLQRVIQAWATGESVD